MPAGIKQKVKFTYCIKTNQLKVELLKKNDIVEIKPENFPEDLKKIATPKLFEGFFKDAYVKVSNLSNSNVKLYISQRLKGGMLSDHEISVLKKKVNSKQLLSDEELNDLSEVMLQHKSVRVRQNACSILGDIALNIQPLSKTVILDLEKALSKQ